MKNSDTFFVRVKRGPFSGLAVDRVRLNVVPGLYKVSHIGNHLVFENADSRSGGSITVSLAEYTELGDFPHAIYPDAQIELATNISSQ